MGLLVQRVSGLTECEFLAMKHTMRIGLVTLLPVSLVAGGARRSGEQPPALSADWVEGKAMAIRVDRFL